MKNLSTGLSLLLLSYSLTASAAVLYDNGPVDGTVDARNISQFDVTDSFTLSSDSTLTGVTFGVWNFPGDTGTSLDWSITANPFDGSPMYSGTATLSNAFQFANTSFGYDINISSFSVPSLALSAGTYWLQLGNAATGAGTEFWDQSSGSSSAFQSQVGAVPSQSFQILGDAAGVPEPNSVALSGAGLLLLSAGALRRKLSR